MDAIHLVRKMIKGLGNYTLQPITNEEVDKLVLIDGLLLLSKQVDEAIKVIEESPDCDCCDREREAPDYSWRD